MAGSCGQRALPVVSTAPPSSSLSGGRESPIPTLVTPPASANSTAIPGIEAAGIGALTGQWVFVLSAAGARPNGDQLQEVWAVSADGRTSQRVVQYSPHSSAGINITGFVSNNLGRQVSPDGKSLLLAATVGNGTKIVLVDLSSGRVTQLTHDIDVTDVEPAWSPDGSQIAFARTSRTDPRTGRDLWIMRADGSGSKRLASSIGTIYGFTPDGRSVCYISVFAYVCLELASTQVRSFAGEISGGAGTPWRTTQGAWRSGSPGFVGSFSRPVGLYVADAPGGALRALAQGPYGDPRWRPTYDEILTVTLGGDAWGDTWIFKADGTGRKVLEGTIVRRAEWSPDGSAIYVIATNLRTAPTPPAPGPTSALRRSASGGSPGVEIFRPTSGSLIDLFAFAYK